MKDFSCIKQHQWNILLAHALFEKAAHGETHDHYLWPGPLPEEAAQPIQPVVVRRGFKEDWVEPQAGGWQLVQSIYDQTRGHQPITHQQHRHGCAAVRAPSPKCFNMMLENP